MDFDHSRGRDALLSRWQRRGPALTLVVLAPVTLEVLSGATRLSYLFVLIPEILVWGLGALMIREAVRRWGGGGRSILLLGLAFSMAEEFLIQQTSLAPLPWGGPASLNGRWLGVNWLWLLAMLGFESVWVVVAPIELTEILFRSRRADPWLRTGGLATTGTLFVCGCFIAWYAWTQRARPTVFHLPQYHPLPIAMLCGAAAILLVVLVARRISVARREDAAFAPRPWVAGLAAFVLVRLVSGGQTAMPAAVLMIAGLAWAAVAYLVME